MIHDRKMIRWFTRIFDHQLASRALALSSKFGDDLYENANSEVGNRLDKGLTSLAITWSVILEINGYIQPANPPKNAHQDSLPQTPFAPDRRCTMRMRIFTNCRCAIRKCVSLIKQNKGTLQGIKKQTNQMHRYTMIDV